MKPSFLKEERHCDMRRGYAKARSKETLVKNLLALNNVNQQIGILSQQGVYEFHRNNAILLKSDLWNSSMFAALKLSDETKEVQQRVLSILSNYYTHPFLLSKNILELSSGKERGSAKFLNIIKFGVSLRLYYAFDCLYLEDDTVNILDFKTGSEDYDLRQAYVYLVVGQRLYPNKRVVALFYNLETSRLTPIIELTPEELEFVEIELADIALKHYSEKKLYQQGLDFASLFPPNPGKACKFCSFKSICLYVKVEE